MHLIHIHQNVALTYVLFLLFQITLALWADQSFLALHEANLSAYAIAWHHQQLQALVIVVAFAAVELKLKAIILVQTH